MICWARAWLPIVMVGCVLGCAPSEPPMAGASPPIGGKADNFYSPTAQEYVVEGRLRVTLEEALRDAPEAEREARLRTLIGYKHTQLAYFLTQYLIEKDPREPGAGWGGHGGMAKSGSYREMDIRPLADGLTYSFRFRQVVAGAPDLLERLPLGEGGLPADRLVLTIGDVSNDELSRLETDHEWFRDAPWADWDPDRVTDPDRLLDVTLSFRPEEPSSDAWLDYPALFADGLLRVDLHLGYDYHAGYHRAHARALYLWLRDELGFDAPVASFEALTRRSGPFTSTLDANGEPVRVEVRLFYGQAGGDNDPRTDAGGRVLEADLRESLRTADVVLFVGHSGPFYGFAMADWRATAEGDLSYREIESVEMAGRYQIVVADGCDTYQIAAAFARNPMTPGGRDLDVITTTSYGDAALPYTAMNMLLHLVESDPSGSHRPRTVRSLLLDLTVASSTSPLYGIHFVDDDPTIHPYADLEWLCEPCRSHGACGAPGNRCVRIEGSADGFCAAACTSSEGCPEDFECGRIAAPSAGAIYELGCIPREDRVCWWR